MTLELKNSEDLYSDQGLLVLGIYAATLSPILHSTVDFDLRSSGVFALFLFLSSMVWHETEKFNITSPSRLKINSKLIPYPLLKVVMALLALFILYLPAITVMAEYFFDKAIESLEYTMGRGRRVIDAQILLAEVYRLKGETENASVIIDSKLKEDPEDGFANFIKGNIYRDGLDFQSATDHYLKALEKSSGANRRDVLTQLGPAYVEMKEFERALNYLEIELSENPRDQFVRQLISTVNKENSGESVERNVG